MVCSKEDGALDTGLLAERSVVDYRQLWHQTLSAVKRNSGREVSPSPPPYDSLPENPSSDRVNDVHFGGKKAKEGDDQPLRSGPSSTSLLVDLEAQKIHEPTKVGAIFSRVHSFSFPRNSFKSEKEHDDDNGVGVPLATSSPYAHLSLPCTSSDYQVEEKVEEEYDQPLLNSNSGSIVPQTEISEILEATVNESSTVRRISFNSQDADSSHQSLAQTEADRFWSSLAKVVKERDLAMLRVNFGGVQGVRDSLQNVVHGCDVSQKEFNPARPESYFPFLLKACKFTHLLLLFSAVLSIGLELKEQGIKGQWWHDGAGILVAVFLLLASPSVADFMQARKKAKKLERSQRKQVVHVLRDGQKTGIPISHVVVGDVVLLKKEDRVPAEGLLLSEEDLVLDELLKSKVDCHCNPFLFSGSTVKGGKGQMLVTHAPIPTKEQGSDEVQWSLEDKKTLLTARINKPNSYIDYLASTVSILIALVLLIRLFCTNTKKHKYVIHNDAVWPELKAHLAAPWIMRMIEMILLNPGGKVWVLAVSLAAFVIGFQQGIPLVITISLSRWNNKARSDLKVDPHNLYALGTMGVASVICIDITGGLICKQIESSSMLICEQDIESGLSSDADHVVKPPCQGNCESRSEESAWPTDDLLNQVKSKRDMNSGHEGECLEYRETKSAVKSFEKVGARIILVSEDEVSIATTIAHGLGFFSPDSICRTLEGKEFQALSYDAKMEKIDQIKLMGSMRCVDKLTVVQCLQKKGCIVAFFGGSTTGNCAALKEADVGIVDITCSTEMAKECSDIIIFREGGGLVSVPKMLECGKSVYCNIQRFTQVQLTTCVSGLVITFATTIFCRDSSLTPFQLIWAYSIMCLVGDAMMVTPFPADKTRSAKRAELLVTKDIWRNVVVQVMCQSCVLLIFQCKVYSKIHILNDDKVVQAMLFNSFVMCQVLNELNAMNVIKREMLMLVLRSRWLMLAFGGSVAIQVVVAELGKSLCGCARLNMEQWAICFLVAATSWGLDYGLKLILLVVPKWRHSWSWGPTLRAVMASKSLRKKRKPSKQN